MKIYYLFTLLESWFDLNKLIYFALLLVLILSFACGSSPTENKTITVGNWSGFYLDTIPITFSVDGSSMEDVSITIDYQLSTPGDTTVVWSFTGAIEDDSVSCGDINGGNSYTFSLMLEGAFTPPDQVHGTILTYAVFDSSGVQSTDTLNGTWSATPE